MNSNFTLSVKWPSICLCQGNNFFYNYPYIKKKKNKKANDANQFKTFQIQGSVTTESSDEHKKYIMMKQEMMNLKTETLNLKMKCMNSSTMTCAILVLLTQYEHPLPTPKGEKVAQIAKPNVAKNGKEREKISRRKSKS